MGLIRKHRHDAPIDAEPDPRAADAAPRVAPLTDDDRLVLSYTLDPETMLPPA